MNTKKWTVRRVLGAAYLVAGIGKIFPQIESTKERLTQALDANTGHVEERPTRWLLTHAEEANTGVAVAMSATGSVLLQDPHGRYSNLVLVLTLPMLGCFMTILRRAIPPVVAIDLLFAAGAVYALRRERPKTYLVTRPSTRSRTMPVSAAASSGDCA